MKGYRAKSGNYITGKEILASQKRFKAKQIISKELYQSEQEVNDKIKTAQICSNMIEQIKNQEKQTQISIIKDKILLALRASNPFTYPQYLIIWDMLNYDYSQIMNSLSKGKITKNDITNALEYIKTFSNDIVSAYWSEVLVSA